MGVGGEGGESYSGHWVSSASHQFSRVLLLTLAGSMVYWAETEVRRAEAVRRAAAVDFMVAG